MGSVLPPPDIEELRVWELADASNLRIMRASLFEAVTGQVMAAQFTLGGVADRMVLVATELATNALVTGVPPVTVRLCRCGPDFVLDVADRHHRAPPGFDDTGEPGSGRLWLRLAQRFSAEVGWYVRGSGRHVWARFHADDDHREVA
ncbi:ATP-binding protein [Actinoplanes sp. NPDC051494]|uniref:ATP-binding protein n=1 Tax=Actinoplanes sp. NPDC051494 TaxID=3363907 RepID=UPI0037AE71B5